MNKFLTLLTAAASLTFVTALGFDQQIIDGKPLDISNRFLSGQLEDRLTEIHTEHNVSPVTLNAQARAANVKALRHHSVCALTPDQCHSSAN